MTPYERDVFYSRLREKDMAAKIMSASQLQMFLWGLRAATACAPEVKP